MREDLLNSFDRSVTPRDAVARWGGDPASLVHAGDGQNFVYGFRHPGGQECFLRLTHESHRTRELIEAECEFVAHLSADGCAVAAPVRSAGGRWVETIATRAGELHAAAFWAVHGLPVRWGSDLENRRILLERGELLARIHRSSQRFRAAAGAPRRFRWDQSDIFTQPQRVLPPRESDEIVWREYDDVAARLRELPSSPDTFGLVHGDLLSSNCLRSGGRSIAFDFDDCCYHWFAFDLAVAMSAGRDLPEKYRRPYLQCLLDGYASQRPLPGDARAQIDLFCRLAVLYRYALLWGECDPSRPQVEQQRELQQRRRAIVEPVQWS